MERITFGILDIPIDMRMFPHLNPVNPTMKILILILIVYASISGIHITLLFLFVSFSLQINSK